MYLIILVYFFVTYASGLAQEIETWRREAYRLNRLKEQTNSNMFNKALARYAYIA